MKKSKKDQGYQAVLRVVVKSKKSLRRHDNVNQKELDRVEKIFKTVYQHATKHGQDHTDALKYCLNVYKEQAPKWAVKIVNDVIRETKAMRITESLLRRIIVEELHMSEADIIKFPQGRSSKAPENRGSKETEILTPDFSKTSEPSVLKSDTADDFNRVLLDIMEFIEEEIDRARDDKTLTEKQFMFLEDIADTLFRESGEFDSLTDEFDDSPANIARLLDIERELLTAGIEDTDVPEAEKQKILARLTDLNQKKGVPDEEL